MPIATNNQEASNLLPNEAQNHELMAPPPPQIPIASPAGAIVKKGLPRRDGSTAPVFCAGRGTESGTDAGVWRLKKRLGKGITTPSVTALVTPFVTGPIPAF